jgi:hypothetical protein
LGVCGSAAYTQNASFLFPMVNELQAILEHGEIEIKGQFVRGNNYTFLVSVCRDGKEIPAVYKPQRGEQPLWDFPVNSLAGREVCAYQVSQALGLGIVPLTILRDGPLGPGSVQQYIDHNPDYHYFNFRVTDLERLRPSAFFDLLVNNADRKGSHILVQKRTRKFFLIDHGLCFHTEEKLRTVIWDFAGEAIPVNLLTALSGFRAALAEPGGPAAALAPYLSPEELEALRRRADALLETRQFPYPPEDRRSFPYPPI